MKIGDLNIGDLLRFNYVHGTWPSDLGIVTAAIDDINEVEVHWNHEEENPSYHDNHEMDDWLTRGLVEVVNENR